MATMSPEERAKLYAAQGCLVRAVVMYRKLVETEPTAENLSMLAALYMEEGLHEEAQALYLRVVQLEAAKTAPAGGRQ
jgi:Flp pilus assembly protein TadD